MFHTGSQLFGNQAKYRNAKDTGKTELMNVTIMCAKFKNVNVFYKRKIHTNENI